jgi:hypothetical protein
VTVVTARAITAALGLAAIVVGTSACSSTARSDSHTNPPARSTTTSGPSRAALTDPFGWLMTRQVIAEVWSDSAARRRLSASPIDELLQPGQQPLVGVPARTVESFASAAELQSAVREHALPAHTYAVLYDPEGWAFTPISEQRNPVAAAVTAAATAHAHGLQFFVAPGLNLSTVLSPSGRGTREAQFLSLRLVGQMARSADAVELQAQSLERNRRAYRSFVTAAAAQARAANPEVHLIAGLSTNPPGAVVTVSELRDDIRATRSTVNGYWLNVPGAGARCPTCNASRPDIAIELTLQP